MASSVSSAPTVRLGIVGIGNMGTHHAQTAADGLIDGCQLSAICDIDPSRAELFPGTPFFSDHRAMLRSEAVDAVLVSTPHYSHLPIGRDILQKGRHLLMEKPLTVHKTEAEMLIAVPRRKGQVFAAMFNQRTDPYYLKIREMVQGGALGTIRRINWTITDWFRTEAYYRSAAWRATWSTEGGGVLLNQCVHNIDLFQWIFGMPLKVRSLCQLGHYHDIEVEDAVSAIFEFPDGATATFSTSTGEAPGINRLEIAGEKGLLVLEKDKLLFRRNVTPASEFSRTCPEGYLRPETWQVEIPLPNHRGGQHREVLQNFVNAIRHGSPLIAPADEGIRSVELTNAILMASLLDRTVSLPLSSSAFARLMNKLIASSRPRELPAISSANWSTRHDFGAVSRKPSSH